jgi:hypothetical protein
MSVLALWFVGVTINKIERNISYINSALLNWPLAPTISLRLHS